MIILQQAREWTHNAIFSTQLMLKCSVDTHHSQPQTPMITQRELARHMASAAATALWESGNYREPDTYGMSLGLAQLVLKSSTISN